MSDGERGPEGEAAEETWCKWKFAFYSHRSLGYWADVFIRWIQRFLPHKPVAECVAGVKLFQGVKEVNKKSVSNREPAILPAGYYDSWVYPFWSKYNQTKQIKEHIRTQALAHISVNRESGLSSGPGPEVAHFPFGLSLSPRSQHLARAEPSSNVSSVRWHQHRRQTASLKNFPLNYLWALLSCGSHEKENHKTDPTENDILHCS